MKKILLLILNILFTGLALFISWKYFIINPIKTIIEYGFSLNIILPIVLILLSGTIQEIIQLPNALLKKKFGSTIKIIAAPFYFWITKIENETSVNTKFSFSFLKLNFDFSI